MAENFLNMENVSGLVIFQGSFPVAERVEGDLFDSSIFEFGCYSLALFVKFTSDQI